MLIYYFCLAILIIGILVFEGTSNRTNQKAKKRVFTTTIILFALIAGCRAYSVGHDTGNYAFLFQAINSLSFRQIFAGGYIYSSLTTMEKGYMLLCWLIGRIFTNYTYFLIILSLFEFSAVGKWIWENSKKPFSALLVFFCMFFTFFLTGIRQTLAFCILLFANRQLCNNNLLKAVILVAVATLFHYSAVIYSIIIVLYQYLKNKHTNHVTIILLVMYPILFLSRNAVFNTIISRITRYSDFAVLYGGEPITYSLMLIMICIAGLITSRFSDKSNRSSPIGEEPAARFSLSFELTMVAMALVVMPFVGINGAMMRVAMYFSFFVCLIVPEIISRFTFFRDRFISESIIILILCVLFLRDISGSSYVYSFVGWDTLFNVG